MNTVLITDIMQGKNAQIDPDFGIIIRNGLDKVVIYDNGQTINFTHYFSNNFAPLERYTGLNINSPKAQKCLAFALEVACR